MIDQMLHPRSATNGRFVEAGRRESTGGLGLGIAAPTCDDIDRAWSGDLDADERERLQRDDQPFTVRLAMADRFDPDTCRRAACDRDPVIRAVVLHHGIGLDDTVVHQLESDPEVNRAAALLGYPSVHVPHQHTTQENR